MKGFDRAWVEAAQDCGASEWQIFRRVILPNLRPGILVVLVLTVAEYWNIIDQAIIFLDSTVRQPLSVSLSQMLATEKAGFSLQRPAFMCCRYCLFLEWEKRQQNK